MACRRSQVRSLSGPPFTTETRREVGFLLEMRNRKESAKDRRRRGAVPSRLWRSQVRSLSGPKFESSAQAELFNFRTSKGVLRADASSVGRI